MHGRTPLSRLQGHVVVLAFAAFAGCTPSPPQGILLISIDTLRSDALETYGCPRPTSPFLLELSAGAAVFENAYCPLPGTLPSHMSMLTGLYPEEHGVYPPSGVLGESIPLLAERFQAAGYRTFGSTEGGYVHGGYGFSRGFEQWSHEADRRESDVETTISRLLRSLAGLAPGERYFAFMHTYVVHDPYGPPEPYASQFWPEAPVPSLPEQLTGPELLKLDRSGRSLSPRELSFLRARYDAQVRYVDELLRQMFAELRKLGLLDSTLVVITSDHGEEFGEHGRLLHHQVHRECLQVPLIVLDPRLRAGRRISAVAETIDLTPTILDLAGLTVPMDLSGESLAPWILGDPRLAAPTSPAYVVSFDRSTRGLVAPFEGHLFHLMHYQPKAHQGHVYFGGRFNFDITSPSLRFGIVSLDRARSLAIHVDGQPIATELIGFGNDGRTLEYELQDGPFKREVTLYSAGCAENANPAVPTQCLEFQLVDQGFSTFELYDLARDPREATDLSAVERRPFTSLSSRLGELRFDVRGEPGVLDDPALRARLRALGYLQ